MDQDNSHRRRLAREFIVLSLLLGAGGCMTRDMWDRATVDQLAPGEIRGFVASPQDPRVPTAVVVSYSPIGHRSSAFDPVLAVPFDQAVSDPSAAATAPTSDDFARGSQAMMSRDFTSDDPRYPGLRWQTSTISSCSGDRTCLMTAVPARPGPPGQQQRQLTLMLPARVERPATDLANAQAGAALLTAPMLAADTVLDPIAIAALPLVWDER